jgi:DNA-binding transcriptional ArsR family regulator
VDKIFKALADKNRRLILTILKTKGEMSVNELLESFSIGQSTLSNHLAILRKAHLVEFKIKGKLRIYKINGSLLEAFIKELNKFVGVDRPGISGEILFRGNKT